MLTITKAESLSLVRENDIWGDLFNYRNRDIYTVRGRLLGDYSLESITQVWAGMSGMIRNVTGNYIPFSINGLTVGTGRIKSLNFEPSTDVRDKKYNLTFEVLKTGNLYNLTGSGYESLQLYLSDFGPYFNSLSETYGLSQSNSDTINFTHDVNLDFDSQFSDFFAARYSGASLTAANLFNSLSNIASFIPTDIDYFSFFVDSDQNPFSNSEGDYYGIMFGSLVGADRIKYKSETFDVINGKYSFSERYSYQTGLYYVHEYNHSLNYGENGVTDVSENGFVKATARVGTGERIYYANVGFSGVELGIYSRVTGIYQRWNDLYSTGGCPIVNFPTQKSISRNYPAGQIDYSYSYTNNPAQKSGYSWSYENSVNLQSDGYLSLSENGSLEGALGQKTGNFPIVSGAWYGMVKSGIPARINSLYNSTSGFFQQVCGYSGTPTVINSEESFNEYRGAISYSYEFTDDPSYFPTGNFVRIKATFSDNKPVHLVNFLNIVNFQELAQGSLQSTLGTYSNNIQIIGRSGVAISTYLAAATANIQVPSGMLYSLPPNYTFSPNSREFNYQQDYIYTKYRNINDHEI